MPRTEKIGGMTVSGPIERFMVAGNGTLDCVAESIGDMDEYTVVDERIPSGLSQRDLIELLQRHDAEGVITRTGVHLTDEVFKACDQLRLAVSGSRNPDYDSEAALRNGVWTLRSKGNCEAVAERLVHALRSFADGTLFSMSFAARRKWDKRSVEGQSFDHLFDPRLGGNGVVLGIMGFGQIGQQVARYALANGFQVKVCNDGRGAYFDSLEEKAELIGLREDDFVKDPRELFSGSDIVTLHMNDTNAIGESNEEVIDENLWRLIGTERPDQGIPKTLVNWARAELVPPLSVLSTDIVSGGLEFYITDVFGKTKETPAEFKRIMNGLRGKWSEHRVIPTCHTAGSGKRVELAVHRDITRKLLPAWESGDFKRDQFFGLERHDIERMSRQPGDLVLTVITDTSRGIKGRILDVGTNMGLSSPNDHSVADTRPSGGERYSHVPRTYIFRENGTPVSYDDAVREFVGRFSDLNAENPHIVGVRFIPTTDMQREVLKTMPRWTHNLGVV